MQCHDNWSHVIFQDWQRNGSDPAVDYRTYRSKDKGYMSALTPEIVSLTPRTLFQGSQSLGEL